MILNNYYRYMNKNDAEEFINKGIIYFNSLEYYKNYLGENEAIKDIDEGSIKDINCNDENTYIELSDNKNTVRCKIDFRLKSLTEPENFYIFCLSKIFNKDLFEEFKVNACVEILNVKKLECKIKELLPEEFKLHFDDVIYYDPAGSVNFEKFLKPVLLYKSDKYKRQEESRFYFCSKYLDTKSKSNYKINLSDIDNVQINVKIKSIRLELGNLSDICRLILK